MAYDTVKSVEKALAVMELLASGSLNGREATLNEIAAAVGIAPATARNLLRTLEERGYAARPRHGHYTEGPRLRELFFSGGALQRLKNVAEPILRREVEELGESLLLVTVVNNRRYEILRCQTASDRLVDPQNYANERCYAMRTTRVALAWFDREKLARFLACNGQPSPEDWPEASGSDKRLSEALHAIRLRGGCADEHGEWAAIAVPVRFPNGEVAASLGCYALLRRTDRARREGIFRLLGDCAREIGERLLGGR